jgi:hypothetical protein
MLANTLKTAAMAALLGLGVAGASGTGATAYTIKTKCNGDDCVRIQCNDFGYDCFRVGYFDRNEYDRPYGYTRTNTYYPPRYDFDNGYYDDFGVFHPCGYDYDEDDYPG